MSVKRQRSKAVPEVQATSQPVAPVSQTVVAPQQTAPQQTPAPQQETKKPRKPKVPKETTGVAKVPKVPRVEKAPKVEKELKDDKHAVFTKCGLRIPHARTRTWIDSSCINKLIDDSIEPLKVKITEFEYKKKALENGFKKVPIAISAVPAPAPVSVSTTAPSTQQQEAEQKPKYEEVPLTSAEISEFKLYVEAHAKEYESAKLERDKLTKERVRFNSESCLALAFVCDGMVAEMVEFAKVKLAASESKRFVSELFLQSGIQSLGSYALFKDLPSYAECSAKYEETKRTESLKSEVDSKMKDMSKKLKDIRKEHERLVKKVNKLSKKDEEKSLDEEPRQTITVVLATEEKEDTLDGRNTFKTYVKSIYKDALGAQSKVRVDRDVTTLLSNIVIEFIQKVSSVLYLLLHTMKTKTVTEDLIFEIVEIMLAQHAAHKYELKYVDKDVPDREELKAARLAKAENSKLRKAAELNGSAMPEKFDIDLNKIKKTRVSSIEKNIIFNDANINSFRSSVRTRFENCSVEMDKFLEKEQSAQK